MCRSAGGLASHRRTHPTTPADDTNAADVSAEIAPADDDGPVVAGIKAQLGTVDVPKPRRWLVPVVIRLAKALDESGPSDAAKNGRELADRMAALQAEVHDHDDEDWTKPE